MMYTEKIKVKLRLYDVGPHLKKGKLKESVLDILSYNVNKHYRS